MRNVYMSAAREIEAAHRRACRQALLSKIGRGAKFVVSRLVWGALGAALFFSAIHATNGAPAPKSDPAWHGVAIDPKART